MARDDTPVDLTLHKANKQAEQLLELEKNLETMQRLAPMMQEFYNHMARLRYAKYQALLDAGFREEQAIAIIMHDGDVM